MTPASILRTGTVVSPVEASARQVHVVLDNSACSRCLKRDGRGCAALFGHDPDRHDRADGMLSCTTAPGIGRPLPGQYVEVELDEPVAGWWRLVAAAYGLPVIGLLSGAVASFAVSGHAIGAPVATTDAITAAGAVVGLLCGLAVRPPVEHMLLSGACAGVGVPTGMIVSIGRADGGGRPVREHRVVGPR